MYRSRRRLEPKIPSNATELYLLLPTTTFGKFHKSTVSVNDQTALIFFSDKMRELIPQIPDIQFDGTSYCVPKQFYQLWTIFVTVERHTLPAIHCLLTGKEEGLYRCIMEIILLKRADAQSIYSILIDCLKEKYIQINKLVGMGFDGAVTFSGKNTGVQARMKNNSPHVSLHTVIAIYFS